MRFNLGKKRIITFKVPPYRRRLKQSLICIGIFLLLVAAGIYAVDFRIRPTLIQLARTQANQMATRAINEAISARIVPDIHYQNLIKLQLNQAGEIALVQPNTGEINRISSVATLAVQKRLQNLPSQTLVVPLGQILGLRMMAGYGPSFPIKVIPVGFVESSIYDRFDTAGINQVRHRIILTIQATVKLIVPLVNQEVRVKTDVPLVETIIVGAVPNVYAGSGGVIIPASK
ncbi:MAG TPA: sporulation protein YunB [Bacillota bacterium]|nr:sporulation protein YunB [Bacillota bacterium]